MGAPAELLVDSALPMILTFWTNNDRTRDENGLQSLQTNIPERFDFIIVGGGCAGAVVANRLSRNYNVLLLEFGGEMNPVQFIPLFASNLFNYPEVDFGFRTVTQRHFDGLNNKQVSLSQGKGLGGGASLNTLIYLRGNFKDFDNWANITGDPSWSWEGVLPFFKSIENYEVPGDNVNHGYDGELNIQTPDYIGTARELVAAAQELGYPNVDLNAPFSEGFDLVKHPLINGARQATYKAFLEPVRTRPTLTIRKFSQVNKILMRDGNIAEGVLYDHHGKLRVAYAVKEVIITAGAISTPKLLQLSGIGPRNLLESLNIPVVSDLPVGLNLKDHPNVLLGPFLMDQPRTILFNRDITMSEFVKWATVGRGRLTTSSAIATGLIVSSLAKARGEYGWPDIQFLVQCVALSDDSIQSLSHSFNFRLDVLRQYFGPSVDRDACILGIINVRPLSKGYVTLGTNSPYDPPLIQPNYFEDEKGVDVAALVEGVKIAVRLMENTTAYGARLGVRLTDEVLPLCANFPVRSDAYWECYVKQFSLSIYHPSGTAAMGKVVDTQLRVFGVENLRVLDQSVAPELVSANTMASTIMIAEKGSNMILEELRQIQYKYQPK